MQKHDNDVRNYENDVELKMNVQGTKRVAPTMTENQLEQNQLSELQKQIFELKEQHKKELERKDEQIRLLQGK